MSTLTLTAPMIRPRRSVAPVRIRSTGVVTPRGRDRSAPPRASSSPTARRAGRPVAAAARAGVAQRTLPPAQPSVRLVGPSATATGCRRAAAPALRLTRRGRLAIVTTVLAVAAAASLATGSVSLAGTASAPVPVRHVVVEGGDTLWSIAADVAPGADRRDTVAEIIELNALSGSGVRAGQQLAVPASR